MSGHDWRGSRWTRTWECSRCGKQVERAVSPSPGELFQLGREDTPRTFDGTHYTQRAGCDLLAVLKVMGS